MRIAKDAQTSSATIPTESSISCRQDTVAIGLRLKQNTRGVNTAATFSSHRVPLSFFLFLSQSPFFSPTLGTHVI